MDNSTSSENGTDTEHFVSLVARQFDPKLDQHQHQNGRSPFAIRWAERVGLARRSWNRHFISRGHSLPKALDALPYAIEHQKISAENEDQGKTVPTSRAARRTECQWLRHFAFVWVKTANGLMVPPSLLRSAVWRIGYSHRYDYPTDMV
jgi:hypothetical protein